MCEEDEKIIHRLKYYNDQEHLAKRIVELQHCIENLQKQLHQKENIIKEVREYIDNSISGRNECHFHFNFDGSILDILDILDKENK